MLLGKVIKEIMKEKGMRQADMASSLGMSGQSAIANLVVAGSNNYVDRSIAILEKLGYEIVVQPRKPGRRPEGQIVLTTSSESEEENK